MKRRLLAALFLSLSAHAAEQRIECPARYPSEDIMLPQSGDWHAGRVLGRLPLTGGGMLAGPLEQQGELRGSEQRIKNGFRMRFAFDREQDPPGKWFLCYYGSGGAVQLARRMADTTTSCTLTHEDKKFPQEPKVQLSCQ